MTDGSKDKLKPHLNRTTLNDAQAVVVKSGAVHINESSVGWTHGRDCANPLVEDIEGFRSDLKIIPLFAKADVR